MSMEMDTEIGPTDNAELYRKATTVNEPLVDHKHLEFISVYDDERILLGAANLTGRFWNGSVWIYDDSSSFNKKEAFVNIETESVVCDAAFVERDKFVVVEDSGVLQVFSIVDDRTTTTDSKAVAPCIGYTCQHDDSILSVSVFDNKTHIVTGGMDRCIKVWNIAELLAEHSYDGAHRKIVTCVDTKPKSNDVFASSSLDREAVVWDVRKKTVAEVIYDMTDGELNSVAWSKAKEHLIAVGGNDGSVILLDIRKPRDPISHSKILKKSIRKLKYDSKRPHLLAVCSDDTEVKIVTDTKNFATVYHDQRRHSDFVRGIAWYKNDLLTCSWDNTVIKHEVPIACQDDVK